MLLLKKKLLIVDDQYAIRKLLEEMFRSEDYETFEACNGEQALQLLDQEAPDLVLLDMKMPGLSGLADRHDWTKREKDNCCGYYGV